MAQFFWSDIYCTNRVFSYTWNVLDLPQLSIWAIAASSRTVASNRASLLSSEWLDSRQYSKSDFTPTRSLPPVDRAGWTAWFSWENNSYRSPSLVWQEMYSLENSPQSLLRAASWFFCIDFIFTGGRLNVHCISLCIAKSGWSAVRAGICSRFRHWTASLVISMEWRNMAVECALAVNWTEAKRHGFLEVEWSHDECLSDRPTKKSNQQPSFEWLLSPS